MNKKTNFYFEQNDKWQDEIKALRKIILDCHLTEELKWGCPCYTLEQKNIVLIHVFKEYCALLFFKGALMKDPQKILKTQSENVQAARQIRFTALSQIIKRTPTLTKYIFEAVRVEMSGAKVPMKKTKQFKVVEELQNKFEQDQPFKAAFERLTPGRQRGYLLYFSSAKQSKTRESRIEKSMPHIFAGKGFDEQKTK